MSALASEPTPGYASVYQEYRAAGWLPMPLRRGTKFPPPTGFTGDSAADATEADYARWARTAADGGVALRLPGNVVGIDVDDYEKAGKAKSGAAQLAMLEAELGDLPPTWRSSSRGPANRSGIRFYRVAEGLGKTVGRLAPDIDVIQPGHRYAVAAPSIHPEGGVYCWHAPDGSQTSAIPTVADLPLLPTAWLDRLHAEKAAPVGQDTPPAPVVALVGVPVLAEAAEAAETADQPCPRMARIADMALAELQGSGGSGHTTAMKAIARVVHAVSVGHRGDTAALARVRAAFAQHAHERDIAGEWDRLVAGAERKFGGSHGDTDPCDGGGSVLPQAAGRDQLFAASGVPVSWNEARETGGWSIVDHNPVERRWLIARADACLGLWEVSTRPGLEPNSPDVASYSRVADWVAWRESVVRTRRGDLESSDPQYVVVVREASGRESRLTLDAKASLSPALIQEASGCPISLPPGRVEESRIRTALARLGSDERDEVVQHEATGWVLRDAKHVFVAPAGSVSTAGIVRGVAVLTSEGAVGAAIGWQKVPATVEEHRAGVAALMALQMITPRRQDWPVAMVGAVCAAPLALPRRTTVVLQAERGGGKSVALSAVFSALADVPLDGRTLPVSVPGSTMAGARLAMRWHRHLLCAADDFRQRSERGSEKANSDATAVFAVLVQGAYGAAGEAKSTRSGQMRATETIEAVAVVTAEVLPPEAALVERAVVIPLRLGDVDVTPDGGIDRYRQMYAENGMARLGFAGYLAWLAGRLDNEWGSVAEMSKWARDRVLAAMADYRAHRAGEGTAVLAAGWAAFREYAEAVGAGDLLPSQEAVDVALKQIVASASTEHAEADPGQRVIAAIRDMLGGGLGHVSGGDGSVPYDRALESGYQQRSDHTDAVIWAPAGRLIGRWSADRSAVLLVPSGLGEAQKHAGLTGLDSKQIKESIAKRVLPGSQPGGKVPLLYGIGTRTSRPAGYLVSASLLGLDNDGVPEATPEDRNIEF